MIAALINLLLVLFLLAGVPLLSFLSTRQPELLTAPRRALYFSAVLSQWLLAVLTAFIIVLTSAGFVGFATIPWTGFVRWTVGLFGASLAGMGVGALLESTGAWPGESPLVRRLIPRTRSEKLWALLIVAPTAGVCEEFVYRGYLLSQLSDFTHSAALAWALSSIAFGLCHGYQRSVGAVRATLLGALLAAPVVLAGAIYPSMAAHFLIDVAGLLWIGPASIKERELEESQV